MKLRTEQYIAKPVVVVSYRPWDGTLLTVQFDGKQLQVYATRAVSSSLCTMRQVNAFADAIATHEGRLKIGRKYRSLRRIMAEMSS